MVDIEIVPTDGADRRRITAQGRDIYAISAPLIGEGAERLLTGRHHGVGALAPGQAFDAAEVLASVERTTPDFRVDVDQPGSR